MARSSYLARVVQRTRTGGAAQTGRPLPEPRAPLLAPPHRLARADEAMPTTDGPAVLPIEGAPAPRPAHPAQFQASSRSSAPGADPHLLGSTPLSASPIALMGPPSASSAVAEPGGLTAAPRGGPAIVDVRPARPEAPHHRFEAPRAAPTAPPHSRPVPSPVIDRSAGVAAALDAALRWVTPAAGEARASRPRVASSETAAPRQESAVLGSATPRAEVPRSLPVSASSARSSAARAEAPQLLPSIDPAPQPRIPAPAASRSIHIGTIEVQLEPPPRPPEPPHREMPRTAPAPPGPLARELTSVIGLRQG